MIRKVLIAEDQESASISLQKTLEELNIVDVRVAHYCDDAFHIIENGLQGKDSFDLLITDLHFEEDYRAQRISGGQSLIRAVREIQPDLKIIVFSAESKPTVIDTLLNTLDVDGYVRKARNDAKELREAVIQVSQNRRHLPRKVSQMLEQQNSHQFTDYDVTVISLLADGIPQKNIPDYLSEQNIKPSGLSSVEKRLNHIRETLQFTKNEQLVAFCKDMGII